MLNYFLEPIKDHYADFEGRASVKQYWMFVLCNIIASIILGILTGILGKFGTVLTSIYSLGILIPGLAISIRRLHDTGKSWTYVFVTLIPLAGGIWYLILMCQPSEPQPNQYGEVPAA